MPSGRRNPSRCWSPPRRSARPRRETSQSAGRSTPVLGPITPSHSSIKARITHSPIAPLSRPHTAGRSTPRRAVRRMARPTLLTRLIPRLQAPGIAPLRTPRPRRRSRRLIFSACSSKSPPPTPRAARGSPCATRCATTFTAAGARASTLRQLTRCGEGTAATSAAPSSLARRSADVCCTPQRLPPSRRAASLCSQR